MQQGGNTSPVIETGVNEMTDEEKKEYRDKLVEDCMKYNHIDYDDDKDIVETMVRAIASEELMELIQFRPHTI